MFTGIIEEKAKVVSVTQGNQSLQLQIARPESFTDIQVGDSVACNGVCLTIENFDKDQITFTIGYETLKITGWKATDLLNADINLERSLMFGQRIHGHLVSGHVDTVTPVLKTEWMGDCFLITLELPTKAKEIWTKSSVALNGVSLTVNWIENNNFQVCLVPETLKKTNLSQLKAGDMVNVETDYYMKGLLKIKGEVHA